MLKKGLTLTLCALMLLACTACGNAIARLEKDGYTFEKGATENTTGSKELYVYNWGEYMRTDLNDAFTYETGIQVHYSNFDTNEDMYAKLRSGTSNYDIIVPSDYMVSLLIEENMLEKLDFSNIPNFTDVNEDLRYPAYDPENLYSVPYTWGTMGIIYNAKKVGEEIDSWGAMFDERFEGDILMINNSRDALGIALKYLGYSFNTTNEDEIQEAFAWMKSHKHLWQGYVMDQIFDKMENNEAAIGAYYAGDAREMMKTNSDLRFVIPKEGANLFVDAFCIPAGAKNKTAAEMYINFMCGTQAGLANAEEHGYSTPLISVYAELDDEIKNDGFSYADASDPRFETFVNLPKGIRDLYSRYWTELKA